jgi:hypothetical protein
MDVRRADQETGSRTLDRSILGSIFLSVSEVNRMKTSRFSLFLGGVAAALLAATAASAQMPAYDQAGPVPAAILAAKTIFVSNAGSDSGLFPEPFTGDQDRPYTEFTAALKATGSFVMASDPSQADLVLELRLTAPNGPANPNKVAGAADPLPMLRLVVYDRKSHYILWTLTQSVVSAIGQKNHDRTFDDALSQVLAQFLRIAGKPPATH